jgi:hypothetical protein
MREDEASFERRGFAVTGAAQQRLERVGAAFLSGYNAALGTTSQKLVQHLDSLDAELRGFAYEGAAMGLSLLDQLTPWRRNRWRSFLEGRGWPHIYMMHVGAGWAVARIPWRRRRLDRALERFDPLLRWLVVDGYGFHEGYFHWPAYVHGGPPGVRLTGYAARAFDQGFGRSLWFVDGADPARIAQTISRFPHARRGDLWSGVGLAASYAGGVDFSVLSAIAVAADEWRAHVAQGAAFAAGARARAGNPAPHTALACGVFCGTSAESAAGITEDALEDLHDREGWPAYEVWRQRIQARFTGAAAI